MKKKSLLLRFAVLVAAMMCALGAAAVEAYACYTPSNTTLTFYYDAQRSSRTGTTYDLNTGNDYPGWYSDNTKNNVTKVVFDPSFAAARPTTTCAWFRDMTRLQTITGLYYLNTSQVTSMKGMFAWCDNLQSVDVSNFNTANVTDMIAMFACCEQLSSLNLSHFSTSNVTLMSNMFVGCYQLTSLDVSSFNTDKVTNMYAMFGDCPKLTSLDLSGFKTTKVTDMSLMFHDCSQLQTIYVGDGWSTTDVTNSSNMFKNCTSLVGGMGTTYDASHIDKAYAHIDGGPSNPGYFTAKTEAYACYTSSNKTLTFYYDNQRASRSGTTYDLNTGTNDTGWDTDGTKYNVTKVVFDPSFANARPTTTCDWFYCMTKLESITGMSYLNTSEVTNMNWMFMECYKLTSLDLSHFNTSKVMYMTQMFSGCTGLTSLGVSGFNTSQVTNMADMFYDCSGLTGLDLSSFNTANVTDMSEMFYWCSGLTSLDVSHFNTANVTSMKSMFSGCSNLSSLNLSSFNTAKVTDMYCMFSRCSNLTTVYVSEDWSTEAVTTSYYMFYGCTSLVGGQGTTWNDSNPKDKTYAHIDGGPSNPGYLTEIPEAYACYTPSNKTLTFYYDNYRSSRTGTTYDLNTGDNITGWESDGTNASVTMVVFDPSFANARPTTTYDWFYGMTNLQSITGMEYLNTSEVTDMGSMFMKCSKLTSLDVSHFNTSKVIYMNQMFYGCTGLTSLDLSSFNTSQVIFMNQMFCGCTGLTSLDLSSFNTSNVTTMRYMFEGSTLLRTIYVGSGWSTAAVTISVYMFNNCTSLVGGQGTTYNSSNPKDKTYAHIDGGTSNPGYFTDKNAALRGDVDGNGNVNISDVTALINLLLTDGALSAAADCNQDGKLSINDVTSLINYLLSGQW